MKRASVLGEKSFHIKNWLADIVLWPASKEVNGKKVMFKYISLIVF